MQPPAEHQGGAQALLVPEQDEVGVVPGRSPALLGEGDQVDVVLVRARHRQRGGEFVEQRRGVPAGQVGGVAQAPGVRVEGARGADDQAVEVGAGQSRRPHRAVQGVGDLPDDGGAAAAAGGGQLVAADRAAGEVGDGGADPPAGDVEPGDVGGGRVDPVQPGARAGTALGGAGGQDQSGGLQAGQELGGGRFGQSGEPADPGARQRPVLQQEVQGGAVVHGAQHARGARCTSGSCHGVRHPASCARRRLLGRFPFPRGNVGPCRGGVKGVARGRGGTRKRCRVPPLPRGGHLVMFGGGSGDAAIDCGETVLA